MHVFNSIWILMLLRNNAKYLHFSLFHHLKYTAAGSGKLEVWVSYSASMSAIHRTEDRLPECYFEDVVKIALQKQEECWNIKILCVYYEITTRLLKSQVQTREETDSNKKELRRCAELKDLQLVMAEFRKVRRYLNCCRDSWK